MHDASGPKFRPMVGGTPQKKTLGVGAIISAMLKFVHPSALVRKKYRNLMNRQRLVGCRILRQEVKQISCKDQLSLIVTHEDFKDANGNLEELHAVKKHFTIQHEGDPDFFDKPQEQQQQPQEEISLPEPFDLHLTGQNQGGLEDLQISLTCVMDVDDDSLPAPENNFPPTTQTYNILSNNRGHDGVCFWKEKNYTNTPAKLTHPVNTTRDDVNLQIFEWLFPQKIMEEVMIPTMNQLMNNPVSYGSFCVG